MSHPTAPLPPSSVPAPPPRRSKAPWIIAGAVVVIAVLGVLAFGVFGVHTLFIDDTVDEAGPTFESGAAIVTTPEEAADPEGAPVEPTEPTEAGAEGEAPAVTTASTGTFTGVDHPGEGTVNLLTDGNQTFVRFEDDFSTDNGPDLFAVVYVGGERIELGVLKGNRGAQNYELPADIDPAAVSTVAVWCKRFDSTFTEAELG